jgi:predicted nucleic acid binding AN1-type Zn finger protein
MEFPTLGERCSQAGCGQLDFLPLKCNYCKISFCKEHANPPENHQCTVGRPNREIPICPICSQSITGKDLKKGNHLDLIMNEHIESKCQKYLLSEKPRSGYSSTYACSVVDCSIRSVVKIECPKCKKTFCTKHRWETDHKCQSKSEMIPKDERKSVGWYRRIFSKKNTEIPKAMKSGTDERKSPFSKVKNVSDRDQVR